MQVMRLILSGQIDTKIAGLLLYALQTAAINLRNTQFEASRHESVIVDPGSVSENSVGSNLWHERDFEYEEEEEEAEDEDAEVPDEEDDGDNEEPAKSKRLPRAMLALAQRRTSPVSIKAAAASEGDARPLAWLGFARDSKKPPSFARLGRRGRLPLRGRENGRRLSFSRSD